MRLHIDVFFHLLQYLPFEDIVSLCQIDSMYHKYGTKYETAWKSLIYKTYGTVYNFQQKILHFRPVYDYVTYTQFIHEIDEISKWTIYLTTANQKPVYLHDDDLKVDDFLARFLLGDVSTLEMYCSYLGNINLASFLNILKAKEIEQNDLDWAAYFMGIHGNMRGMLYLINKGANLATYKQELLSKSAINGYLEIIKYMLGILKMEPCDHYSDPNYNHEDDDECPFLLAVEHGHQEIVKYLAPLVTTDVLNQSPYFVHDVEMMKFLKEIGVKFNDHNLMSQMCRDGNFELVKYLMDENLPINNNDLSSAILSGNLDLVKFLIEKKQMVFSSYMFRNACTLGHMNIVKYLIEERDIKVTNEYLFANNQEVRNYLYKHTKTNWWFISILAITIFLLVLAGSMISYTAYHKTELQKMILLISEGNSQYEFVF